MKKVADRREVSIRGETYEKVRAHIERCKKNPDLAHLTVAGFIDTLCMSFFARGERGDQSKKAGSARRKSPASNNGANHHADQDHRKVQF